MLAKRCSCNKTPQLNQTGQWQCSYDNQGFFLF